MATDGTPGLAAAHEGRMAMSAAELVSHLYRRRDERQRGSAGWVDLDRAVMLLDRAWSRPGMMATYELAEARRLVSRWVPELADDVCGER
jgi:hypothetical protein